MTENEWLADPQLFDLLDFFQSRVSKRRVRLFACACCRRVWDLLHRDAARRVVELAEAYADGEVSESQLWAEHDHPDFADIQTQCSGNGERSSQLSLRVIQSLAAARDLAYPGVSIIGLVLITSTDPTSDYFPSPQHTESSNGGSLRYDDAEMAEKVKLLHDIFGTPFRPTTFSPAWRTDHTVGIATKMYDERNFDAMPILADALEDAGCDNEDILRHCRESGVHVRGCWVVDLVLGKE